MGLKFLKIICRQNMMANKIQLNIKMALKNFKILELCTAKKKKHKGIDNKKGMELYNQVLV
jgi:hypothetical protein